MRAPAFTQDLTPSERKFLAAMQELGFGRLAHLRIRNGEIVLNPWQVGVRNIKFGTEQLAPNLPHGDFALKQQVTEFFEYVRSVDSGEIRTLEVKHGLPFSMTVDLRQRPNGGRHG